MCQLLLREEEKVISKKKEKETTVQYFAGRMPIKYSRKQGSVGYNGLEGILSASSRFASRFQSVTFSFRLHQTVVEP